MQADSMAAPSFYAYNTLGQRSNTNSTPIANVDTNVMAIKLVDNNKLLCF